MTPELVRGARAMLDMEQGQLAEAAGVSRPVVIGYEAGSRTPMPQNLAALRRALEEAGAEFIPAPPDGSAGPGVRLRSGAKTGG